MNFEVQLNIALTLFILVLTGNFLYAQKKEDKIYAFYQWSPATKLKDDTGLSQSNMTYEIQLGAPPISIGKRLKWINFAFGSTTNYQLKNLSENYKSVSCSLIDARYGVIFIYDFKNPKWSLFLSSNASLRSDFKRINFRKSIFPSGILLFNFNPDSEKRLIWSFGLAFANDFNRNVLIPIVGLTYNSDKFSIEISYPRINLLYKPHPKIEWGLTASILGGIYKTQDLVLPNNTIAPYTRIINVQTGQTFNYLINKRLVFNSCIGFSVIRNYDLIDEDFKQIQSAQLDLKSSVFLRTGLSFRL